MRTRIRLLGLAALSGAVLVASCTTFDGLVATLGEGAPPGGGGALPGYLPVDDAVRLCARATTCPMLAESIAFSLQIPVETRYFSDCVAWLTDPLPGDRQGRDTQIRFLRCSLDAKDCAAARLCMPYEKVTADDPRCQGVAAGVCIEENRGISRCPDYLTHCENPYFKPGQSCVPDPDEGNVCGVAGGCAESTCDGSFLQACYSNPKYPVSVYDCASSGYACGLDQVGEPGCLTRGNESLTCQSVGSACTGNLVAVCDGYQFSQYNCEALGGTCDSLRGPPRCVLPADECSPYDADIHGCDGTSITLCLGGKKKSYDCAGLGLSCKPATGDSSAHCG